MKLRLVLFLAAASSALLLSCIPMQLSPECKAQISECLKDCPDPPNRLAMTGQNDRRTKCESHCQSMCND